MSGLILAGIGKGISEAGQSYGNMMFKAAESDLADQRALQRATALEQLKEQMLEERAQKDAAKATEVEGRATKIAEDRTTKQTGIEVGRLGANAQSMAGDSPAMSPEEYKAHLESLTPEQRNLIAKTGLIDRSMTRNEQRLQGADDQVQAARELGASSTLLKSYQETKKTVLDEIKAENSEKRNEQRHAEVMAQQERLGQQFQTTAKIAQQNADSNRIRAEKPAGGAGGGAAKVRSTYTDDQGNKIAVMSDGTTKQLGRGLDFDKQVASLVSTMSKNDYQFGKLPEAEKRQKAIERLTGGTPAPKTSDNADTRPPLGSFKR